MTSTFDFSANLYRKFFQVNKRIKETKSEKNKILREKFVVNLYSKQKKKKRVVNLKKKIT